METTFITIHNVTPEANILFASESIVDILGYRPEEVTGKSCFDYFHPEEVPFAHEVHDRSVQLDKAAVLHYLRIKNRDGQWVACECVFTIVYDVLVACTSIYRGDVKNERRAAEAPAVRRLFVCSPQDPRYHMLEHLSAGFRSPPQQSLHEPRAALILNRFTRTLTVLYAINAVSNILGVSADQFTNKSFYECIQENCLSDAIRCLESAKANDSIAYLRFWYRDPRRPEDLQEDTVMCEASQSTDSEDGDIELHDQLDVDSNTAGVGSSSGHTQEGAISNRSDGEAFGEEHDGHLRATSSAPQSKYPFTSPGGSADLEHGRANVILNQPPGSRPSIASTIPSLEQGRRARLEHAMADRLSQMEPFEIEAVVSCTSDGLVVVLRRARPMIPPPQLSVTVVPQFANGLFTAPWDADPIRSQVYHPSPQLSFSHDLEALEPPAEGPPLDEFMDSIQDVAVFAWSLAGINGKAASYGRGISKCEAQTLGKLPVWDPYAQPRQRPLPPEDQVTQRRGRTDQKVTTGPVNDNKSSYQHSDQEVNHDTGTIGSDQSGSYPSAPLANKDGYVC